MIKRLRKDRVVTVGRKLVIGTVWKLEDALSASEDSPIACILDRGVARRILRHLGLPDEPPVSTPSRAPPVLEFA